MSTADTPSPTTKLSIVYYSGTGNVHKLAVAAEEAAAKAGADVRLRRVPEYVEASLAPEFTEWTEAWSENAGAIAEIPAATADDLDWADAILIGGPGRFGMIAAPLKHFIELAWPSTREAAWRARSCRRSPRRAPSTVARRRRSCR